MTNNRKHITFRKRFVTLIEMMIVMFLIALITGVVAYNYRGSLEEGKAFKTKAGIEKLQTILNLAASDNQDVTTSNWTEAIKGSPLVQNPEALMKDGWGNTYVVSQDNDGNFVVTSPKYEQYKQANQKSMFK